MAKNKSRTKKLIRNVIVSIIGNIVSVVCGLIVPRLILNNFGSETNGITQSISQFISYISLMQAGVGGATVAALYKPLAEGDDKEISEILASTQKYMRKVTYIFGAFIVVLSCVYPLIVNEFEWLFSASLIFIISISTFAEYYLGFTYQCLLNADQKGFIVTILQMVTVVLNAIVSVILLNNNFSIHIVKLGASFVNIIPPIVMYLYVKKNYNVNPNISVKEDKIPQKWNAAAHEVAQFINNNTDIVILTMFADIKDVSIYTVYHYVTGSIKKIVTNFSVGFGHAFGDMYAKKEYDLMIENLGIYETIIYSLTSVFCGVTFVLMLPFVSLYTKGVTDANYIQPLFSFFIVLACAFNCFRVPYRSIVFAIGHYKQTRNGAILEAIINIVISVCVVIKFGLVGVAIGTLCAMAFRTFQYGIYLYKNVLNINVSKLLFRILTSFSVMLAINLISRTYINSCENWVNWFIYGVITTIIAFVIILVVDFIFYRKDLFNICKKLKMNFTKKKV